MSIRVPKKICVIYKRTEEEKRIHSMGKELDKTKKSLDDTSKELEYAKLMIDSLTDEINDIKKSIKSTE